MNLNLPAYFIFLGLITFIIVVVGRICYRNGNVYVEELLHGHKDLCLRINRLLLAGYYLVNIGYACTTLISWEDIRSLPHLIETLAFRSSVIVGILSALHYLNIFLLTRYAHKLIH